MRQQSINVDGRTWTVNMPDFYAPLFNTILVTVTVPPAAGEQVLRLMLQGGGRTLYETRTTYKNKVAFSLEKLAQSLFVRPTFVSDGDDERILNGIEQSYTFSIQRKAAQGYTTLYTGNFYGFYGSLLPSEDVPYCRVYNNFPSYLFLGYVPQGESQVVFYVNGMAVGDLEGEFGQMYMSRTATADLLPDFAFKDFRVTDQHDEVCSEGEVDCAPKDSKHLCLRFLNRYGCPQTAVLAISESGSQGTAQQTFTHRAPDYDERQRNAYGVFEQLTHATRQELRTVTCGLQGVSEREVERLRDLFLSPHVELWQGDNNWQEVYLEDGGFVTGSSLGGKLQDIAVTFTTEGRVGAW